MADSEKLDLILSEMQGIKTDVQGIKTEMQGIKTEMQGIKTDVQGIKTEMQGVKTDVQGIKTDVQDLKQRTANIETSVTDIKLILENEIRVNIQRVAEGHLDLSRNLHEAIKIDSEKEMLVIRVNVLETELRKIKTQLGMA